MGFVGGQELLLILIIVILLLVQRRSRNLPKDWESVSRSLKSIQSDRRRDKREGRSTKDGSKGNS